MNGKSISEILFELADAGYEVSFQKFPGPSQNWIRIYVKDYEFGYSVSHVLDKSEALNMKLVPDWILKEELLAIKQKIEQYEKAMKKEN